MPPFTEEVLRSPDCDKWVDAILERIKSQNEDNNKLVAWDIQKKKIVLTYEEAE